MARLYIGGGCLRFIIFDLEVFAYDWIVVFKEVGTNNRAIFHNDNEGVCEFLKQDDAMFVGYNNKHYDNYIAKAGSCDWSPREIKQLNDFIINGGEGWEYPPLKNEYFRFNSCDLFDDVQQGLSLKAIEAHLGMDIEETEVDFNIQRPLTPEEIEKTIRYCSHDVDATEELFNLRKSNYLQTKINLGNRANISPEKSLYATNAKLTAMMLGAVRKEWDDGRDYVYPKNLDLSVIPKEILDFFETIHDMSIPDEQLFRTYLDIEIGGMLCRYAWGGVHGSLLCYHEEETENRVIQNRDVSSLYPSLIEIYKYLSRNVPNPQLFYDMRSDRLLAKRTGDKETANDLKLPLNTVSGAQENKYNDLYDPLSTRSMRISGQLFLTVLTMRLLKACSTIKLLNLNTDGLMYSVDKSELHIVERIAKEWEEETKFELETDNISKVWIKDVNNLLFVNTDGKIKKVGGYLNYGISMKGAWSINNNFTIVKDAVVDYFTKGVPLEDTINACDTPLSFQIVAKAGSKYSAAFHYIDGEKVPIQKVNRVYATKNRRYGTLVKVHALKGNDNKIGGLPDHCIVDNNNTIDITEIDKNWYVRMAQKYVDDFLGISRKRKRGNTRKINSIKKQILKLLEE